MRTTPECWPDFELVLLKSMGIKFIEIRKIISLCQRSQVFCEQCQPSFDKDCVRLVNGHFCMRAVCIEDM